jgi:hypothetical protein
VGTNVECWHLEEEKADYARIGSIVALSDVELGWFTMFFPEWYRVVESVDEDYGVPSLEWNVDSKKEEYLDDPLPVNHINGEVMVRESNNHLLINQPLTKHQQLTFNNR